MLRYVSLTFAAIALFISCHTLLFVLARDFNWPREYIYAMSTIRVHKNNGVSVNLYGVFQVSYCWAGSNVEKNKMCAMGHKRYYRYYRPSEKSEG